MEGGNRQMNSFGRGRGASWIIFLLVLAIAAAALITGRSDSRSGAIRICVFDTEGFCSDACRVAFRDLVAAGTRRTVTMSAIDDAPAGDCDLLIVPAFEWLCAPSRFQGRPVLSIGRRGAGDDEVLVVTGGQGRGETAPDISIFEIQFANTRSVNGFWNPLELLRENGARLPKDLDSLRTSGGADCGCERELLAVLSGSARAGVCGSNCLRALERSGALPPGGFEIAARAPALPALLIVSTGDDDACKRLLRDTLSSKQPEGGNGLTGWAGDADVREISPAMLERLKAVARLMERFGPRC